MNLSSNFGDSATSRHSFAITDARQVADPSHRLPALVYCPCASELSDTIVVGSCMVHRSSLFVSGCSVVIDSEYL